MSLSTIIYLAQLSDNLQSTAVVVTISSIIILLFGIGAFFQIDGTFPYKFAKIMGLILGLSLFVAVVFPSKNTIYTMIAANGITDLAKTPEADKARKVLDLGLDKMINNLQESK